MSRGLRVMVIDDSVVARRALVNMLASDPEIGSAFTAPTGKIALRKIPQVSPDVVVLDYEMAEMTGLEVLERIRAEWPTLPVIMCSAVSEQTVVGMLSALSNGNTEYLSKRLSGSDATTRFRTELLLKVKALGGAAAPGPVSVADHHPAALGTPRPRKPALVTALAIGASTGGPVALTTVLKALPSDLSVPVFVVQHMPPLFTSLLASRLASVCQLPVSEAHEGDLVMPGHIYIAKGDHHLRVVRDADRTAVLSLDRSPPENSCRPAVDVLFRSLADVYGDGVLAAVLTGMGTDGSKGSRFVVGAGGQVFVQSPETCVVASMPAGVISGGLATEALALEPLAERLIHLAQGDL